MMLWAAKATEVPASKKEVVEEQKQRWRTEKREKDPAHRYWTGPRQRAGRVAH